MICNIRKIKLKQLIYNNYIYKLPNSSKMKFKKEKKMVKSHSDQQIE